MRLNGRWASSLGSGWASIILRWASKIEGGDFEQKRWASQYVGGRLFPSREGAERNRWASEFSDERPKFGGAFRAGALNFQAGVLIILAKHVVISPPPPLFLSHPHYFIHILTLPLSNPHISITPKPSNTQRPPFLPLNLTQTHQKLQKTHLLNPIYTKAGAVLKGDNFLSHPLSCSM